MANRIYNNLSIYLRFEGFQKSVMLSKFRVGEHSVILLISCETILLKAHGSRGLFLRVAIHNSGHTVSDPMIFIKITLFVCTSIGTVVF